MLRTTEATRGGIGRGETGEGVTMSPPSSQVRRPWEPRHCNWEIAKTGWPECSDSSRRRRKPASRLSAVSPWKSGAVPAKQSSWSGLSYSSRQSASGGVDSCSGQRCRPASLSMLQTGAEGRNGVNQYRMVRKTDSPDGEPIVNCSFSVRDRKERDQGGAPGRRVTMPERAARCAHVAPNYPVLKWRSPANLGKQGSKS